MKKGGIGRGFRELLRELLINLLHFLDGTHLDHWRQGEKFLINENKAVVLESYLIMRT